MNRINLVDERKELAAEACQVLDNYNSWKRRIWKNLITIQKDEYILSTVSGFLTSSDREEISAYLHDMHLATGIDTIFLNESHPQQHRLIRYAKIDLETPEMAKLRSERDHPYIELRYINGNLYLIGVIRLDLPDVPGKIGAVSYVDLFLIKMIGNKFCDQLSSEARAAVAFYIEDSFIVSSTENIRLKGFQPDVFTTSYTELFNEEIVKKDFSLAVKRIEGLTSQNNGERLFLITILSNEPYLQRLLLINKTVLIVSLTSALISIVVSLFISKRITKPIENLLNAMYDVRDGNYSVQVGAKSKNEIGELFRGFNDMASMLNQDKMRMEDYINEITILKDYNEKIIQSIGSSIAIINSNLTVEKINKTFLETFDLREEEVVGKEIFDLDLEIFDPTLVKNIKTVGCGKKDNYSRIKRVKNHAVYEIKLYPFFSPGETRVEVTGCVLIIEDISRKIEFEEKIFQAEKLSSISMLSAGVAHEINNPLSSIMTNVQNLISDEPETEKKISLQYIEKETERIASIVQELLDFSSNSTDEGGGSDINHAVCEVINVLNYSVRKNKYLIICTELQKNIPFSVVGKDEVKQIVINLMKNSLYAVNGNGRILVKTSVYKENKICMTVEDNGMGIREDLLPHVFDPFFTTKENGKGTGLGLSVVYGIVKKNNGSIRICSKEGKGTKIKIYFPAVM